jgi:molybdopterin molybdotransferase
MISFEDAQRQVMESIRPLGSEMVPLENLSGRALSNSICTPIDLPGFDSSAMDGYAVKIVDIEQASETNPIRLKVTADIQAGDLPTTTLKAGSAQRVMTGAPIPSGTDAIVIREATRESTDFVDILTSAPFGANIRRQGEEFRKGDEILPAGIKLNSAAVALIASLGFSVAAVGKQPRASIITTGSEVVLQGSELKPGQLYNSNRWGLIAALKEMHLEPVSVVHIKDTIEATKIALQTAAALSDLVISTGGVSMGDSDFVKPALRELGAKIIFDKVAVKPGMPMCFAKMNFPAANRDVFFFGCPGNPVSVLLSFHSFVEPALNRMMGMRDVYPLILTAELTDALKKKPGRRENVRGVLHTRHCKLLVSPTKGQFSHMLSGLAIANCLIHFPAEASSLEAGTMVQAELLSSTQ